MSQQAVVLPGSRAATETYALLAQNKAAFEALLTHWRKTKEQERDKLSQLAIAALAKAEYRDAAQIQMGRYQMMETLVGYAERFIQDNIRSE